MINFEKEWLRPVWAGGKQYRETFLMVEENGECRAPFLFQPEKILKVESYDGQTEYTCAPDDRVQADGIVPSTDRTAGTADCFVQDGTLVLTQNSRIRRAQWSDFEYSTSEEAQQALEKSGNDVGFGPLELTNGKYLALEMVGRPELITKYMVTVTYTTGESWQGHCPENSLEQLPRLRDRLAAGEPVSVLVYGDSISCGWDCSGMYGQDPNQPIWPEILHRQMEERWKSPLTFNNTSVGGVDTKWAEEQVPERVTTYHPDLVILGFGMNDRCPGTEFQEKIRSLIDRILLENPEAELVLVATTLPNPRTKTAPLHFWAYQDEYSDALKPLCREGIVLADVQAIQKEMQKRKRYMDLTGNGINHPNDYLARVQVQVIAAVLGLEEAQEQKPFRFAVMGAGNISNKFCDAVRRLEGCEVAAVASKSMERAAGFAEKNKIPAAYDSYREMLEKEKPDCVYIGVLPNDHYELTMLCLDYRTPVLCEKAMFMNGAQAEEVFRRSKEENVFVMEAMWSRFLPAVCRARDWIREGRIGKVNFCDMAIGFVAPPEKTNRYHSAALGGGAARDITVYAYEITTFLLPEKIREIQVSAVWEDTGVDLTDHVTLLFEDRMASLTTSFAAQLEERVIVYGEKGRIVVPHPHYASEAFLYDKNQELAEHFTDETENGFVFEVQEVMDCVRVGKYESDVVPHRCTLDCAHLFDRIEETKN